jgi:hypothetical protein
MLKSMLFLFWGASLGKASEKDGDYEALWHYEPKTSSLALTNLQNGWGLDG